MTRPLGIEFPVLGLSHARVYVRRDWPHRRLARCHDHPHHHGIGEDIIVQDGIPQWLETTQNVPVAVALASSYEYSYTPNSDEATALRRYGPQRFGWIPRASASSRWARVVYGASGAQAG